MSHPDSEGGHTVARTNTVDAVVAAIIIAIGAVVVYQARTLGAGWTSDGPGAGYFPFYIGLILLIGGTGVLVQSMRARKTDDEAFVDSVQLRRVLQVLVPLTVYVAGIMVLGLYVASAVFIALFMVVMGKYAVVRSIVLAVAVNALFFMMFEVWFKVPLYKGMLDPLAFLGY